jgi:hypothetical protein
MASRIFPTVATFGVLALSAASTAAQPAGSAGFTLPVQGTAGEEWQTNAHGSLDVEQAFAAGRARLFYEGLFNRYGGSDPWRTQLHNAGLVAALATGPTAVEVGASAFWRVNDGPWSTAGFRGASVVALVERDLGPATLSATYGGYVRRFADLPSLDQAEHQGGFRALVSLPTRTTLIGAVSVGAKRYDGAPIEPAIVLPPLMRAEGRGMRGRGAVAIPTVMVPDVGQAIESSLRTQWSWTARLAQSLDDRTGVWLEREERRTHGDLPPAVVWTPPLFYDDGVYDDPYAIDARTWRAGVKHVFARGDQVGVWGSRSLRSFAGLEAYGLPGVGRRDTLVRAGIDAVIPLVRASAVEVDLNAGFGYVDNRSTDDWARYTARVGQLGVQLAF